MNIYSVAATPRLDRPQHKNLTAVKQSDLFGFESEDDKEDSFSIKEPAEPAVRSGLFNSYFYPTCL